MKLPILKLIMYVFQVLKNCSIAICGPGLALIILTAIVSFTGCQQSGTENKASFMILGTSANTAGLGGAYSFAGEIEKNLSPSCGKTTRQADANTGTQTGQTQTQGTQQSTTDATYNVEGYYIFKSGETLFLRYQYKFIRTQYTLAPTSANLSRCNTIDFINCNNAGNASCETVDNIKCGGTHTVIFTSKNPVLNFQASGGTIDWSKGFSISPDNTYVVSSNLKLDLTSSDGTVFKGQVECYTTTP